MKKILLASVLFGLLGGLTTTAALAMTSQEKLGKVLYYDTYLSLNQNQSCASCHHQRAGFADPRNLQDPYNNVVSLGSDPTLNGGRNAPTAAYAAFTPVFGWDATQELYFGGQFWDGRADTLKDQAKGPFLNEVEMGMANEAAVIAAIADPQNPNHRQYPKLFEAAYGVDLQTIDFTDEAQILALYDQVAEAIGSFEQTTRFTEFSSKYDYYLAGLATLTLQEEAGLALFEGAAGCIQCHPSQAQVNADGTILPPLFTDHSYDNLGVPKSTNPLIRDFAVDYGLGGRLNEPAENGKFKVATLRNLEKTAPYAHNGYFATLAEIVNFYNTRDLGGWPAPEVPENVNTTELGNLGLTPQDEADLVAFLLTLTDGYAAAMPANFVLPPITPLNP